MTKTFSSKSNAARAAAAVGLGRASCFEVDGGRWAFRARAMDLGADYNAQCVAYGDYLHSLPAKPVQAPEPAKPAAAVPGYKDFQLYGRSAALSPVATVHNFLKANGAGLTRKEALFELSKLGVNYATARTQYQRWFANRPK
jgi:hypothetical protein